MNNKSKLEPPTIPLWRSLLLAALLALAILALLLVPTPASGQCMVPPSPLWPSATEFTIRGVVAHEEVERPVVVQPGESTYQALERVKTENSMASRYGESGGHMRTWAQELVDAGLGSSFVRPGCTQIGPVDAPWLVFLPGRSHRVLTLWASTIGNTVPDRAKPISVDPYERNPSPCGLSPVVDLTGLRLWNRNIHPLCIHPVKIADGCLPVDAQAYEPFPSTGPEEGCGVVPVPPTDPPTEPPTEPPPSEPSECSWDIEDGGTLWDGKALWIRLSGECVMLVTRRSTGQVSTELRGTP